MRKLDIQIARDVPGGAALGCRLDFTAPQATFYLFVIIVTLGYCWQPGLPDQLWSLRKKPFQAISFDYGEVSHFIDGVIIVLDRRGEDARQAESDYWAIDDA